MTGLEKRKQELQKSSESHKMAIDKGIHQIANKAEKTASGVAITGGVLLSAWIIYKLLGQNKPKKQSSTSSRLLKLFKQQISLYILNEGRSKILKYLDSIDEPKS